MSKPFTNPFLEADMSKLFDISKISGDFRMPQVNPEALINAQRKNVEAFTALNQAMFESFQSLWRRQADLIRQTMEENTQIMNSIMSSPSPEDKVLRQAEASKVAFDKCLANVRDIADTVAKCNNQAIETVSSRMNESLDELRGLIKNNRAA